MRVAKDLFLYLYVKSQIMAAKYSKFLICFKFQADLLALGDHVCSAVDRPLHLAGRRPLHSHLRRSHSEDAGNQSRSKEKLD
jgi:hypothetical protein